MVRAFTDEKHDVGTAHQAQKYQVPKQYHVNNVFGLAKDRNVVKRALQVS